MTTQTHRFDPDLGQFVEYEPGSQVGYSRSLVEQDRRAKAIPSCYYCGRFVVNITEPVMDHNGWLDRPVTCRKADCPGRLAPKE